MKIFTFIILIFITSISYGMESKSQKQVRKRDIFFKTIATIIVGSGSELFKLI